jgi:hypothetical protein
MDCNCPAPTMLTSIGLITCGVDMTQIQRMAFQRIGDTFDGVVSDILELADWQTKMSAVDDTKIVVTPLIGGDPTIEAGEAITNGGGDNSTLNGAEEVEGVNPSSFSCFFKSLSAEVEKALKALICEPNLRVYFFLQGGKIACVDVTAPEYEAFLLSGQPFISDRNNAGYGTKDTVNMSFNLAEGWSNDLVILEPNFNPLTDL